MLKDSHTERYVVERTNKAAIRPEEQSEKTESCRENLWNEIQTSDYPLRGIVALNRPTQIPTLMQSLLW